MFSLLYLSRLAMRFYRVGCPRSLWLDCKSILPQFLFPYSWFEIFVFLESNCVFFSYWVLCGSVVLFPVAVTFLITWWFIQFVDGFFSPIYENLGVDIFGKTEKLIKINPPSLCMNWTSFWILWYCYVLLVKLENR